MPDSAATFYLKPTVPVRAMNRVVGLLARLGVGPSYIHLLKVKGRTTGKVYSTAVNLLEFRGRLFLVGGRGHTSWSKNARAVGSVELVRGRRSRSYVVTPVNGDLKLEILKAYLDEYRGTVQRFFAVQAGSPAEAFRSIADRHPVFELTPSH